MNTRLISFKIAEFLLLAIWFFDDLLFMIPLGIVIIMLTSFILNFKISKSLFIKTNKRDFVRTNINIYTIVIGSIYIFFMTNYDFNAFSSTLSVICFYIILIISNVASYFATDFDRVSEDYKIDYHINRFDKVLKNINVFLFPIFISIFFALIIYFTSIKYTMFTMQIFIFLTGILSVIFILYKKLSLDFYITFSPFVHFFICLIYIIGFNIYSEYIFVFYYLMLLLPKTLAIFLLPLLLNIINRKKQHQ